MVWAPKFRKVAMTTLQLKTNNSFSINASVRESDPYSESVYMKFEMDPVIGHSARMDEMFLTPDQLEELGKFLVQEAKTIRETQVVRALTERIKKNPNQG